MKRLKTIALLLLVAALLCACQAVDDTLSTPTVEGNETTAPTTTATVPTIPTEPTMPKELVSEVREDGLIYAPYCYNYLGNGLVAMEFNLDDSLYPGMEITFDVSMNSGWAYRAIFTDPHNPTVYEYYTDFSTKNHFYLYWRQTHGEGIKEIQEKGGAIFVDVVIRANGHIVGYGLFEIGTPDANWFALMRSETVIFPMFNGRLQEVSEDYVAEQITELKKTITPFDLETKQAEFDAYLVAYREQYWKDYYDTRKPSDQAAIIQITSSQDVLDEDPSVSNMNVAEDFKFVQKLGSIEEDPYLEWYYCYQHGSENHPGIYIDSFTFVKHELSPLKITYERRTNYGGFFTYETGTGARDEYLGSETNFPRHITMWVGPYDIPDIDPAVIEKPNRIWIDIVVRDGDYIIGLIIYELIPWKDHYKGYTIVNAYDECYKLVDGHFQSIPEEFVNQRIEAYHRYAESNS